jgi:hypothetical protein
VKITAVRAAWLRAPTPPARQHRSDFGVNDSFNTCLVEIGLGLTLRRDFVRSITV